MINKQTTLDLNGPALSFTQQPFSTTLNSGGSTTFVGIATATYPTQDPLNPAVNTGSIVYQWYVDGYGSLNDGDVSALGFSVTGSATTTLTVSNVTTPTSNARRFYVAADIIPSAYSQPTGSSVIAGTARSTGNAFNDPKLSDSATLSVNPTISVVTNPSDSEVAEGNLATFIAEGASSDGTPVSYRWQLNNSFLSDNGTTIIGSNTNTLKISLTGSSTNTVRSQISHPTASNSPIFTSSANFKVVIPRAIINYENFVDNSSTLLSSGSINLPDQPNQSYTFTSTGQFSSACIYSPERDINIRVYLAGCAGGSNGGFSGGNGGLTTFDITLKQNIEYVFKLGSVWTGGQTDSGGYPNGGGSAILYEQARVLVVSGGGGGAGSSGNGGAGSGAGQAGQNGSSGSGGQRVLDGNLGVDGFFESGTIGGKLSSCTYGRYWRDIGFSPCQNMGFVQQRQVNGTIIAGTTDTINRGFKPGLAYRTNGGDSSSSTSGGGGSGARGANAGSSNGGGGGGSGYTNGEVTIVESILGYNSNTFSYATIQIL
jgi:hypothetical protein